MQNDEAVSKVPRSSRERINFGHIDDVYELPNLINVQRDSFKRFMSDGLEKEFREISPIKNQAGTFALWISNPEFGDPKNTVEECKAKNITFQAPLLADVRFVDNETGEMREQVVFMGDFPLMTDRGTFIVNGMERVIVSQLVRSPGVYYYREIDADKIVYRCQFIPTRGAWLEFSIDKHSILMVSIDRKRKLPVTVLLRALGIIATNDDVTRIFGEDDLLASAVEIDTTTTREEALIEIYKRQRPGEPATIDSARTLVEGLFYNPQRYDLDEVGRYKLNKKLGLDIDPEQVSLTEEDIIASLKYLINLNNGIEGYVVDERDHFGNRRIRTVGELIASSMHVGLTRMERVVRERMGSQDAEEITPQSLINIRPIVASIKEFFGSSQLSQFMDQYNPLAGLTHKRRLSALGPGGVAGHKSGSSRRTNVPTEARDVHNSHYGRMCPIETPEGPNIGLIGSLALFARVNDFGFIEAPYRRVIDGKVTDQIDYMTADEEEAHVIAQASQPYSKETGELLAADIETGELYSPTHIIARTKDFYGDFGTPADVLVGDVDYMDVSPRQMVSVAATLIPFLEHDDAKRTLMGSNMQRQAVPLLSPRAAYVGTGMEYRAAVDSGDIFLAQNDGIVEFADARTVRIRTNTGKLEEHTLPKYQRSNQSTCINHRPIVHAGQKVVKGEVLADGPSTELGELALGQNLVSAYMPWEGYNYEDAIVISERVVKLDLLTSINISAHEVDARDTKLGPEEITREIPNLSEDMLANLDIDGIIRIGAEVTSGDILVGKVTPKGETALTAEERLLRAIFGAKAHDVRDTSLKMPHGSYGRVIDIKQFSRGNGDDLNPGINERVRVYVAQRRKIQVGDKIAGRHGNKGVISRILPEEDMPYMADGTPVDIILDPLGVPSRMNVGQLLEAHLGWAALNGWNSDEESDEYVPGPKYVSTPVLDGASEEDIEKAIRLSNKNLVARSRAKYGDSINTGMIPQLNESGKTTLYDGRTGEKFREPITVGVTYMLKLGHMVDDKVHARSTGPYSLVTQQPLGGKAQFGGQRFGEMEVWALYAYGAANMLHEVLTVKSDDTVGRVKAYEAIVKGENIQLQGVPESFKVLVKEIRSLALDMSPLSDETEDEATPAKEAPVKEVAPVIVGNDLDELIGSISDSSAASTEELASTDATDKE